MWLPRNQYLQFIEFKSERYLHLKTVIKANLKQTWKCAIIPLKMCQQHPKTKHITHTSHSHIIMLSKKCLWTVVPNFPLKHWIDYPGTLSHLHFLGFTDISSWIVTLSLGSSPTPHSSNSLSHFVDCCTSSLIKSRVNHDYCAVKYLGRHDMKSTKKKMHLNLITLYLLKPIYMLKTFFYYIQYYVSYKLQSQSNFLVPFLIISITICN